MRKLKWVTHADLNMKRKCEVRREEYLDYMTFQRNDRALFTEYFGPLVGLKEEWEEQGATPGELDFSAFKYRCPLMGTIDAHTGFIGGTPEAVVEETEEHKIYRDGMGRVMKIPKGFATVALPLDYPVKTMDDWLKMKPHFEFTEKRLPAGWEKRAREDLAAGKALTISIPGAFHMPRELMGDEMVCLAYYTEPEMMRDMLETFAATSCEVIRRVGKEVQIDIVFVPEDLAGKTGPLVGPRQVDEFLGPYYRRVWDTARKGGARLMDMDSDGDVAPLLGQFVDSGINLMHPVEPVGGMDMVKLRAKYGKRLAFAGGIDKHVLRRTKREIDAELEYKIPPMMRTGGCLLGLDHRIPNGTPLENYRYYIRRVWEMIG